MPSATYPSETKYKTRLSRSCGAADSTLYVDVLPTETSDILMIDKDSASNYEIILYTGTAGSGTTSSPYSLTGCVRGLSTSGTSVAAGTGKAHGRVEIGCADVHYYTSLMKAHVDSLRMMPQVANLAALPTSSNTQYDIRFVRSEVAFYYWTLAASSGSSSDWTALALATTPNASTAVPGKVEEATQSENDAGTAAGASADLFATPAVNAATIQKGAWLYAADAGANDTYAITLTPAPAAYTTGMVVRFKANTANTGAATLNVNALGAKTIKKDSNQDLVTGDIKASQFVEVIYDGTNFQLISGDNPYGAKGDIVVGTALGTKTPVSVGSNGQTILADDTQTAGVIWSDLPALGNNGFGNYFRFPVSLSALSGSATNALRYSFSDSTEPNGANVALSTLFDIKETNLAYFGCEAIASFTHSGTAANAGRFGVAGDATALQSDYNAVNAFVGFAANLNATGTYDLYAVTSNGSAATATLIATAATNSDGHLMRFIYTASSVKFYLDNTLVATNTTNIPTMTKSYVFGASTGQSGSGTTNTHGAALCAVNFTFLNTDLY